MSEEAKLLDDQAKISAETAATPTAAVQAEAMVSVVPAVAPQSVAQVVAETPSLSPATATIASLPKEEHEPASAQSMMPVEDTTAPVHVHIHDGQLVKSHSISDLRGLEQKHVLPECFGGNKNLKMPDYIHGHIASITLPSRLALLGRRSFRFLAALFPTSLGNAVIGYAPVLHCNSCVSCKCDNHVKNELVVLPSIFSKAHARMLIFLRVLLILVFALFIVSFVGNTIIALFVMYRLSEFRRAPDGVMAFCRSLGAPETEEMMFSYSWKVEADNIRTMAKAVWQAGVGVWIDVVKLCPGDEIRPMVRTVVNRVHKFNECIQYPEKMIICILKPMPKEAMDFFATLKCKIVTGIPELIPVLDYEMSNTSDESAYKWWRSQKISGAGVPSHVVPKNWPHIERFSLHGTVVLPPKSLHIGPFYLSGDCKTSGRRLALPWLFILAAAGVCWNFFDIYHKYNGTTYHSVISYVWLVVVACCNVAPFAAVMQLFDTRRDLSQPLRPLLATRALQGGVKVDIVGSDEDPVCVALRTFLGTINHLREPPTDIMSVDSKYMEPRRQSVFAGGAGSEIGAVSKLWVRVYVLSQLAHRDREDPFKDPVYGQRMMRYLVLMANWDGPSLAENLFSAIGVRVVDVLHS